MAKKKNPRANKVGIGIFFCFILIWWSNRISLCSAQKLEIIKIGTIMNLETRSGKMVLSCLKMALSDFYDSHAHYTTRLLLHSNDSNRDVVQAASAAVDLIKNVEVQAIIGPQSSMQAKFVIELGEKAQVPIVSVSATSPSLSSLRRPYFFQAAQNDSSQVKAISAIIQAFGWRQAVLVYIDNVFGEGLIPYLTDALQEVDVRVPYRSLIPPEATDDQILAELYKLMAMPTRVFIVHMSSSLGSRFFTKAKESGMIEEGYVWIMTSALTDGLASLNASVVSSMHGALGIKTYVPKTEELENFRVRWKRQFLLDDPSIVDAELNVLGLWAYDAVFALAKAAEKVGANSSLGGFRKKKASNDSTDLDINVVSENGPLLSEALSNIKFSGLAGEFSLVNGQLQSSTFEIVNVNGNGKRSIGFWTPKSGFTKKLNNSASNYSSSKSNLRPIIWPGDSTSQPKGWEITANGKKLRIGVPMKDGLSSFVNVTKNPSTNRTEVIGFCIDVFNAVMDAMPYPILYEFVPFVKPDGKSAGNYSDLIYQVYIGNFDAVVGDITIVPNRSKFVDFTFPYMESGVTMIVPSKDSKKKNALVFFKPLTLDLWVTTGCFCIFIGFVVWVLEHRINEEFRGPLSHQIGTSFWFSFSTMALAQREPVLSNLGRFVVVIWCFVVLILTQSYTASLTSLLTVEKLRPSFTNVNELLKNGKIVGYPKFSFVLAMLKELKFKQSNLKMYHSMAHLEQLFANGEISAAFDESPYLKLFVARHCSNYTMVGPTYKTNGFGFVFPRGSSLVGDVSRAILNVTEGEKMKKIENAWFVVKANCPDSTTDVSSSSLGLNSFWGLFVIAGIASLLALVTFVAVFFYDHRQTFMSFDSETSIWGRIRVMLGMFDQKDLSFHTFKKTTTDEQQDGRNSSLDGVHDHHDHGMDVIEASQNTYCPPSPSDYSNQSESNFAFQGLPRTSSFTHEHGDLSPNHQGSPETTANGFNMKVA